MITAYVDGGSRGNPGVAGWGALIEDAGGRPLAELHGALGIATNNVAEYHGLLAALDWVVAHGHRQLRVRSDSELLVKQMRGEYKVRHPGLQPLHRRASGLAASLDRVVFEHIRRELNTRADRLANQAMDEQQQSARTVDSRR